MVEEPQLGETTFLKGPDEQSRACLPPKYTVDQS